jgi:hypothetical protein
MSNIVNVIYADSNSVRYPKFLYIENEWYVRRNCSSDDRDSHGEQHSTILWAANFDGESDSLKVVEQSSSLWLPTIFVPS